jgi:hypothetical protein
MVVYSLPAHKEFRFLLAALQLLMPFCGLGAAYAFNLTDASMLGKGNVVPTSGASAYSAKSVAVPLWRWAAGACLLLQLPLAAYFMFMHQG